MSKYRRNCLIISLICFAIAGFCIFMLVDEACAEVKQIKKTPLSIKMKFGTFYATNSSDKTVHYFVNVHSWGCGSSVSRKESLAMVEGIDYTRDENSRKKFKPSYFRKLNKYNHVAINPGKTEVMWTWPGSMRCLDRNETADFDSVTWIFNNSQSATQFFNTMDKYK